MAKKSSILLNLLNLKPDKIKNTLSADNIDLDRLPEKEGKKARWLEDSGRLDRELKLIQENNITCVDIFDSEYPELLKQIDNPPLVLYIKGRKDLFDCFCLAIVGSRKATSRGLSLARHFSGELSSLGLVIISGLARGIDSAAHQAAIAQGLSIGVLGSGLLNIYPQENKRIQ